MENKTRMFSLATFKPNLALRRDHGVTIPHRHTNLRYVGVSLHGQCVTCLEPPAYQFVEKAKLPCFYAAGMLVLLLIVCSHRWIKDTSKPQG